VRPLWTGCLAFCNGAVPEAVHQETFARLLGDDPRDFTCLGAEREGRLIGLTHDPSQRHARKVEEGISLQDPHVVPDLRGAGAAGTPMVCRLRQDFNSQALRLPDRSAGVTPFIRCTRRLQALRALR